MRCGGPLNAIGAPRQLRHYTMHLPGRMSCRLLTHRSLVVSAGHALRIEVYGMLRHKYYRPYVL